MVQARLCCKEAGGVGVDVVATGTPVSAESGPVGPWGRWAEPPVGWGSLKKRDHIEFIFDAQD